MVRPDATSHASLIDIDTRVRHLEEGHRVIVSKLDGISERIGGKQATWVPFVGLAIQAATFLMLLIGSTVYTITYVASNANNAAIAVMQERQSVARERIGALELNAGWAPRWRQQQKE